MIRNYDLHAHMRDEIISYIIDLIKFIEQKKINSSFQNLTDGIHHRG